MWRLLAGVDMTELADMAGISASTLSRIEAGLTVELRPHTLYKIAPHLVKLLEKHGIAFTATEYIESCYEKRNDNLRLKVTRRKFAKVRLARHEQQDLNKKAV
jgi:transcriptional regulator with XRE-family HTH domain